MYREGDLLTIKLNKIATNWIKFWHEDGFFEIIKHEPASFDWKDVRVGVAMRDYMAAKALHGILSNCEYVQSCAQNEQGLELGVKISQVCYAYADAMIRARGET